MHLNALPHRSRGPSECIVLVVLSVGDDENDPAGFTFGIEGVTAQGNGAPHSRSLKGNRVWCGGVQEELDSGEVEGQWSLDISITGEDDEANAVSVELLDKAFNGPLGEVKAGHANVFGPHGFAHVEGHHDVHPFRFDFFHAGAPFGVDDAHGQHGDCSAPNQKFPDLSLGPCIRPQGNAQLEVSRFGHAFLLPPIMGCKEEQSHRRDQQGRPGMCGVHIELGRHLPKEHSHSDDGQPESPFEEDQARDVGEDLVAPVRHGSVRMNRWRITASAPRRNRAIQPKSAYSSVFLLYRNTLNRVFSNVSISV